MAKCAIKKGFLILHECKRETSKICPSCGRPACDEHMVMDEAGKSWLCVDCHGRKMGEQEISPDNARRGSGWNYGYRDRYYRDYGYSPYYYGSYYDSYYDDYDTRAFDREMTDSGELPEDDGGPDFMDS